jgi:hypothetical protein
MSWPGRVKNLAALLASKQWRGSTVCPAGQEHVLVTHPGGATARVRLVPLPAHVCKMAKCAKPKNRCAGCGCRCCIHRLKRHDCTSAVRKHAAPDITVAGRAVSRECGGTMGDGPAKRYASCTRCGRIDWELYEGDVCRRVAAEGASP